MKITIEFEETKIIVDESSNHQMTDHGDKITALRWDDQLERVHKTIEFMTNQILRLGEHKEKSLLEFNKTIKETT